MSHSCESATGSRTICSLAGRQHGGDLETTRVDIHHFTTFSSSFMCVFYLFLFCPHFPRKSQAPHSLKGTTIRRNQQLQVCFSSVEALIFFTSPVFFGFSYSFFSAGAAASSFFSAARAAVSSFFSSAGAGAASSVHSSAGTGAVSSFFPSAGAAGSSFVSSAGATASSFLSSAGAGAASSFFSSAIFPSGQWAKIKSRPEPNQDEAPASYSSSSSSSQAGQQAMTCRAARRQISAPIAARKRRYLHSASEQPLRRASRVASVRRMAVVRG